MDGAPGGRHYCVAHPRSWSLFYVLGT